MEKFNIIDLNHDGVLSMDEISHHINTSFEKRGLPCLDSHKMSILMKRYDIDGNGLISKNEFIPYIIDFFKLSRQSLLAEYAKIKAKMYAPEFQADTAWSSEGIPEIERLLATPKEFYGGKVVI